MQEGNLRGPLHGIPIGVKDIIDVKGQFTRCGTPVYPATIPRADAPVIARLRKAGAIFLARRKQPRSPITTLRSPGILGIQNTRRADRAAAPAPRWRTGCARRHWALRRAVRSPDRASSTSPGASPGSRQCRCRRALTQTDSPSGCKWRRSPMARNGSSTWPPGAKRFWHSRQVPQPKGSCFLERSSRRKSPADNSGSKIFRTPNHRNRHRHIHKETIIESSCTSSLNALISQHNRL